jgi:hypothetical protein
MGCNCNKSKKEVTYRHISATGKVSTYTSLVQAKAAVIKNGGRYTEVKK